MQYESPEISVFSSEDLLELQTRGGIEFTKPFQPSAFRWACESNAKTWLTSLPESLVDQEYLNEAAAIHKAATAFPRYFGLEIQVGRSRLRADLYEALPSDELRRTFENLDELLDRLSDLTAEKLATRIKRRKKIPLEDTLLALLIRDYWRFSNDQRLPPPRIDEEEEAAKYPLFAFCRTFVVLLRYKLESGSLPRSLPGTFIRGAPILESLGNLTTRSFRDRLEPVLSQARTMPSSFSMVDSVITEIGAEDMDDDDERFD